MLTSEKIARTENELRDCRLQILQQQFRIKELEASLKEQHKLIELLSFKLEHTHVEARER